MINVNTYIILKKYCKQNEDEAIIGQTLGLFLALLMYFFSLN